jgi:hypothetical protein
MSPIMVGGDDSVKWAVDGDNVRETESQIFAPEKSRPRRLRHVGIDETDPGDFTVVIKLPKNSGERKAFLKLLTAETKRLIGQDGGKDAALTLVLPIEDRRHNGGAPTWDQIKVQWKSSTSIPGTPKAPVKTGRPATSS